MRSEHVFARLWPAVVLVAVAGCKSPGSTPAIPSTPGTFSMTVEQGTTGRGPKTSYSGPATFSSVMGGTQIVLWADSSFSTALVSLFRSIAVTGPGTYDTVNQTVATNNPMLAPTRFLVSDVFTSATTPDFGGSLMIAVLTGTSLTCTVSYSDGVHSVDAGVNAVPR